MSTVINSNAPVSGPVVSVANSSSSAAAGGSVIDVSSLVSQLVAATYASQAANNARQTAAVTTQISALGSFKSALSTFQSALASVDTPASFNALTANSSDQSIFTASAGTGAVAGTYSVGVTQLAQAQQLVSTAVTGGSGVDVGIGTLTVSLGAQSINVTIDATDNTLSGIASAINTAAGNPGVTATIVQGTDGAHLVLASALTGAGNNIQVAASGGDGGLTRLAYSATATTNYTQTAAPQNAIVNIAGVSYQSASNTVSGAISGVTLSLLATTGNGAAGNATVTVSNDTATVATNVSSFVAAYNTLVQQLSSLSGFDATSGTAGPMLGNALLAGIQNQIGQVVHGLVGSASSTDNSLASIGVTTQSDGTLALNSSTLQNALSSDFTGVSQLFTAKNGIASQLNTDLTAALGSSGPVDSYSKTLVQQNNTLTQKAADLTNEEAALTASMTQQFSALNTLLSSLQTTSAYLTQAFANLPKGVASNSSG
jgi:flagellar hook-associated protein 2